jgi:Mannosyltransferase (PIG-V)
MSPDTAEMTAVPSAAAMPADALLPGPPGIAAPSLPSAAPPAPPPPAAHAGAAPLRRRTPALPSLRELLAERLRLTDAQAQALRDAFSTMLSSRVLVWVAGVSVVLLFGFGPTRSAFHPPGLTGGFGSVGDVLAAPAARWDGAWYLTIAHYGYLPELGPFTAQRAAFFPLYPLLIWMVSLVGMAGALAGVLVSLAALLAALYALHRLVTLELSTGYLLPAMARQVRERIADRRVARLALASMAFGPMAFFLSADYSESLYLALSIGVFLQARRGRWMWVGVLGGLAAATRSTGVLLVLPALALYLLGPRTDREPELAAAAEPGRALESGRALEPCRAAAPLRPHARAAQVHVWARRLLTPRYRLHADVLWLALIPAGLAAFMLWFWLAGGEPMEPFRAQALWGRQFAGPFVASWDAARAAFEGARQLLSGQSAHLYFPLEGKSAYIEAGHNIMLFTFFVLAIPLTIGVLRRLPLAYGLYTVAALALPLSYPVATQPLMSIPRFILVLFPLNMWLGGYLVTRRRMSVALLLVSVGALVFFTAQFSTWHWVA